MNNFSPEDSKREENDMALEMEVALGLATQCWCDPRTEDREMDSELATVFAEKLVALSNRDSEMLKMIAEIRRTHGIPT